MDQPNNQSACHGHFVQFYRSDRFLAASLAEYIFSGLNNGEAVVVLATPYHIKLVREELGLHLPFLENFILKQQLVFIDAEAALDLVLTDDQPDFEKFKSLVGGLISQLQVHFKLVRFYSELVNLLCEHNRHQTAIELEGYWNTILKEHSNVMLMCGYGTRSLKNECRDNDFLPVSCTHVDTIRAEHFVEHKTKEDFFKKMARLELRSTLLNVCLKMYWIKTNDRSNEAG